MTAHQETTMAKHGIFTEFTYQRHCIVFYKPVNAVFKEANEQKDGEPGDDAS